MLRTIDTIYTANDKIEPYEFGNIENDYSATKRYFLKNGKPFLPIIGEIHFSRCDKNDWETELLKIKANGLDGVAVYVFWNHHEAKKGSFDFSDNRNIDEFLGLCKKHDLIVVLRIGPWCHGESRYGGFPDWLRLVFGKRKDTKAYLNYVKRYWTALFNELKQYLEGKTIVGLQLENEYQGNLSHIVTLRKMAEEIGFKIPFFTMTAWPTNSPDKRFLPMMGGYPEAPWTQHKRSLPPANRFAICEGRTEAEIGEDLIKVKQKKVDFTGFPYSGCEVGVGNQVTAHRRPIISDKDGYGVAFAKFASGMNWLGYYMYHGGRNPQGAMLQESRSTLYPNNYPIMDYDFQAPISKDGEVRKHADRLRLLHLFIKSWDKDIACSQTCFAKESGLPYCSLRINERSGGYVFVGNYERGAEMHDNHLKMDVKIANSSIVLPDMLVGKDVMFFYPFNFELENIKFDYITAQPITIVKTGSETHCYFMKVNGTQLIISKDGHKLTATEILEFETESGKVVLHFLNEEKALQLYRINDTIIFSDGAVWGKDHTILSGVPFGGKLVIDDKNICIPGKKMCRNIALSKIDKQKLPHNHQLFSSGKRGYFALTVENDVLEDCYDVKIIFSFVGLNLQVFSNNLLIDDYFNTDGEYVLHLKTWKETLKNNKTLIFKIAAAASFGVGKVYNEINMKKGEIALKIKDIIPIYYSETKI